MGLSRAAPRPAAHRATELALAPDDTAPPFALAELELIAAWSVSMRRRGVAAELNLGHAFLTEALHVVAAGTDAPLWMVHKTSQNAVAVRLWPGVADIVPTVQDALAIVADDLAPASSRGAAV